MFSFAKYKKQNLINDSQLNEKEINYIHTEFTNILNKMYSSNNGILYLIN